MEDSFRYDVRIRDRLVQKGLLTKEEVQRHLEALVDVESKSEPVSVEPPNGSSGETAK
jgi:hypothetical protein